MVYILPGIGLMVRVFANGLGDRGSISGRVIPKIKKWYLMPPCLTHSIIRYGSRVKCGNPWKGVAPPTPWCGSYRKGNLRVTLDYGRNFTNCSNQIIHWYSIFILENYSLKFYCILLCFRLIAVAKNMLTVSPAEFDGIHMA